jgi:hypothetical protein
MAMLVVITERGGRAAAPDVSVDATTAHRLAAIGVTNLAVVADDTTQAVVLEGWVGCSKDLGQFLSIERISSCPRSAGSSVRSSRLRPCRW